MAADAASVPAPVSATLDALRDPAVRDLAWLLFSADLLRPQPPAGMLATPFETTAEVDATVAWLQALDDDATALQRDIAAARVTRLGRYAECLLAWFLRHGPAARLIAANVALRRAGLTLGECDFLVETRTGRRLHWELAVKCFLHAGDGHAQLADYVGPNLQDRFDRKLNRLLNHQLPLSARAEFASLGHPGPWSPQMFIKGWLFYRNGETPADLDEIDPGHARGWWTTEREWPAFAAAQQSRPSKPRETHMAIDRSSSLSAARVDAWMLLPRLEWLAPRRKDANASGVGAADWLRAQVADRSGPTMVAALSACAAGDWAEHSRGFIVPDDWPQRARTFARQ
jgi:hypothetical protein